MRRGRAGLRRRRAVGAGAAGRDERAVGRRQRAPRADADRQRRRLDQLADRLRVPVAAPGRLRLGGHRRRDRRDLHGRQRGPRAPPAGHDRRLQRGRQLQRRVGAERLDRRLGPQPRRDLDLQEGQAAGRDQGEGGQEEEGRGQEERSAKKGPAKKCAKARHNAGMAESLRGKLILASPVLRDPNFIRTVVLIAEHTDEGAMGLVLNRPAASTVGEAVPDLSWLAGDEEPVYVGGPVAETAVIVLAEFDKPELAGAIVDDDLGFIGSDADDPERLGRRDPPRAGVRRPRRLGPGPARGRARRGGVDHRAADARGDLHARPDRAVGGGAAPQGPSLRAAGDDAARPVTELSSRADLEGARLRDVPLDADQQPVALDQQDLVGQPLLLERDRRSRTRTRSRATPVIQ